MKVGVVCLLFSTAVTEPVSAQGISIICNNGDRDQALAFKEEGSMLADLSPSHAGIGIGSDKNASVQSNSDKPNPSSKAGKAGSMMSMGKASKTGSQSNAGKG